MSLKVIKNPDQTIVDTITEKLKANDGYCPCSPFKNKDAKCMCMEFRDQIKAKELGPCHCGLHILVEM